VAVTKRTERRAWSVWAITWVSYATYYFGRKNLSVTKTAIAEELGKRSLYGVETAYLAAYAVGQFVSGSIGDRVGARRLVGIGMLVAAAAAFAFGLSSLGVLFLGIAVVNGFAQSTGWPGNVKAMQEWTTPETRGRVMGAWATCYQVGGIAATAFASWLVAYSGWRAAYFGPAVVIALVGVAVLAIVRPAPSSSASADPAAPDRRTVALDSTVWLYGASYFFIKLVRYCLLFWLPTFLETGLHYGRNAANFASTSFEIGGMVGTIAIGVLSDRLRTVPRSMVCSGSLFGLAGALYLYTALSGTSHAVDFATMALVGALLFGPDALLSGAAAQELGGPRAAALAIGMINGLGSFGAVSQELVTRSVSAAWGWNGLFRVLVVSALAAAALLVPTFRTREHAVRVSMP
jgi:sugar phosphate permease